MKLTTEQIAELAHEVNREYCMLLGDDSQRFWCSAPDWQKASAISGVKFHLAALDNGVDLAPSRSHEEWLADKLKDGWVYGPEKNADLKHHPCCVPYAELPEEQKRKDLLFAAVVKAFHDPV